MSSYVVYFDTYGDWCQEYISMNSQEATLECQHFEFNKPRHKHSYLEYVQYAIPSSSIPTISLDADIVEQKA